MVYDIGVRPLEEKVQRLTEALEKIADGHSNSQSVAEDALEFERKNLP